MKLEGKIHPIFHAWIRSDFTSCWVITIWFYCKIVFLKIWVNLFRLHILFWIHEGIKLKMNAFWCNLPTNSERIQSFSNNLSPTVFIYKLCRICFGKIRWPDSLFTYKDFWPEKVLHWNWENTSFIYMITLCWICFTIVLCWKIQVLEF